MANNGAHNSSTEQQNDSKDPDTNHIGLSEKVPLLELDMHTLINSQMDTMRTELSRQKENILDLAATTMTKKEMEAMRSEIDQQKVLIRDLEGAAASKKQVASIRGVMDHYKELIDDLKNSNVSKEQMNDMRTSIADNKSLIKSMDAMLVLRLNETRDDLALQKETIKRLEATAGSKQQVSELKGEVYGHRQHLKRHEAAITSVSEQFRRATDSSTDVRRELGATTTRLTAQMDKLDERFTQLSANPPINDLPAHELAQALIYKLDGGQRIDRTIAARLKQQLERGHSETSHNITEDLEKVAAATKPKPNAKPVSVERGANKRSLAGAEISEPAAQVSQAKEKERTREPSSARTETRTTIELGSAKQGPPEVESLRASKKSSTPRRAAPRAASTPVTEAETGAFNEGSSEVVLASAATPHMRASTNRRRTPARSTTSKYANETEPEAQATDEEEDVPPPPAPTSKPTPKRSARKRPAYFQQEEEEEEQISSNNPPSKRPRRTIPRNTTPRATITAAPSEDPPAKDPTETTVALAGADDNDQEEPRRSNRAARKSLRQQEAEDESTTITMAAPPPLRPSAAAAAAVEESPRRSNREPKTPSKKEFLSWREVKAGKWKE